jgi:hypothetical protein
VGCTSLPFRTTPGAGYGFSTNNNTALLYLKPGHPFGEMTGLDNQGTWSTAEAGFSCNLWTIAGDIKYMDKNKDGKINRDDLTIIGQACRISFTVGTTGSRLRILT